MLEFPQLLPNDDFNRQLEANVHPPGWINPTFRGRYHLVVIGAGTAGLVTAAGAAGLGAKVALIERSLMGGDCLNVGCVPSKGVIAAARVAATVRRAGDFGIDVLQGPTVDFASVMQRMRRLRARISPADSAERFRKLGVDVYFGQARFKDSGTIDVAGTTLEFKRAVIATGARAAVPSIPGLDTIEYLTNETLFSLTELPRRLGIIGAGPIGCEMAQAFAQLGSQVFLFASDRGILPREDRDAADVIGNSLRTDGVTLICGSRNMAIRSNGEHSLHYETNGISSVQPIDKLLISAGRTPNVEALNLEGVGVDCNHNGVTVDDFMRTSNSMIYAAGDVCSAYQFTHAADFMARIVIQNALFKGRKKSSSLVIPWCTYTTPEVAHVGIGESQAKERGIAIDTFVQQLSDVDRAILNGDESGFVKVHVKKGTDRIVGATIVASHAGDMISELTLAMTNGIGLKRIGGTIHPYPTQAEAIRKLGDQYNRTRLTPFVKSLFRRWLTWTQ